MVLQAVPPRLLVLNFPAVLTVLLVLLLSPAVVVSLQRAAECHLLHETPMLLCLDQQISPNIGCLRSQSDIWFCSQSGFSAGILVKLSAAVVEMSQMISPLSSTSCSFFSHRSSLSSVVLWSHTLTRLTLLLSSLSASIMR